MKNYSQMEVIPIYNTMVMVWGMAVGMISMNEIRFYQSQQLMYLAFAMGICVSGMTVLLQKSKSKKE